MSLPQGVFVPIVTPFTSDNKVDFVSFEKQALFLLNSGVDGLVVCGTTGEGLFLSLEEKRQLFRFSTELRKKSKKQFVLIAGTGTQNLPEAIMISRSALENGFDAVLALPLRTESQTEIIDFYKKLSVVGVPLLAYNIPSHSKTNILPETLRDLVNNHFVLGLKDSSQDPKLILEWKTLCPSAFVVVGGDKLIFSAISSKKADAVIPGTGNVLPGLITKLFKLSKQNKGFELQEELNTNLDYILSVGSFTGAIKVILHHKGLISSELKRNKDSVDLLKKKILLEKSVGWK